MRASGVVALALCGATLASGCEQGPRVARIAPEPSTEEALERVEWPMGPNLEKRPSKAPVHPIDWGESRNVRPCHHYIEGLEGEPAKTLPFEDDAARALVLFGCEVEAAEPLEGGGLALAYALPTSDDPLAKTPDMRLAVYGADGSLEWSTTMGRAGRGVSFAASFREGFVADLAPHLLCGGTSWESGVQVVCAKRETGEDVWRGRIATWSGVRPTAAAKSILVADLMGARHVYPYNGAERRQIRFPGSGGRASFYALGPKRLFFGANRSIPYVLSAYDRETLEKQWSVQVENMLASNYGLVDAASGTLVVKSKGRIVGLSTEDGAARWSAQIGEDRAPLAAADGVVYVLSRRKKESNALVALDAKTGDILAWSDAPTGALRVGVEAGRVFVGSVRTVWSAPSRWWEGR